MAEEKLVRRAIIESYSRRALIKGVAQSDSDLEWFVAKNLHFELLLRVGQLEKDYPEGQVISLNTCSYSTTDDVIFVVTILHERAWEPYVDED